MKISPDCIQRILSIAKIEEVIQDFSELRRSGTTLFTKCPKCDKEVKGKGLSVSPAKGIYKCFSCDWGGKYPTDFLMESQGMSYPDALKYLADKYHILLEFEKSAKGPQRKGGNKETTFRDHQLSMSGLTDADQKANVYVDENTQKIVDVFESGTRDQYGKITSGDDMIIWYYDLDAKPVKYIKPKTTREIQLFRIRWQNPDLHLDKYGKPTKYQSPSDSGTHLFIPEQIREAYRNRRVIKRLFIQEGEKKAIKACVGGLFSVGVMGIQNIAHNKVLPYAFELIIKACKVEEVIFVLDSDWDHLSNNLAPGSRVDQRPYSFYWAVSNFREYFKKFINMGIYLEIYFAYVRNNENQEKGIDDLLAGSLKETPMALYEDINSAINEKDGAGKYIQLNKISAVSDLKLLEYWNLQNAEAFALKYFNILQNLPEFIIGKHKWRFNEKGKIEPAQPLQEDEQYWEKYTKEDKSGKEIQTYNFNYMYAYNFLKRRGFGRIKMMGREFELCQTKNKIIEIVEAYQVRDYMNEFTKEVAEKHEMVGIMNMMYRGGKMYFGPDSLSNIDFVHPVFEYADKNFQYLFFKEKYWKISSEGIEEKPMSELQNYVWQDKVNDFDAKLIGKEMITIDRVTDEFISKYKLNDNTYRPFIGQFDVVQSKEAKESHFVQFLINTGEFFWRSFQDKKLRTPLSEDERTLDERFETNLHLVSKMTSIGYLLHKYRDKSCEKAVIGMDGKLSEVGESNGRTGKSLMGMAIGYVVPQVYIGAKSKDLENDPFIFEEVSEKSDNIFLDDVRANMDFEFLFPVITGRLTVNRKGQQKFTLPDRDTPKLYITTNHAINGSSASFKDRQFLIAFSDYYNETWKPTDEFGMNFFEEWDEKQWNLFYNFMANCLQLYFKAAKVGWGINHSGLISAPTERLEKRRLRQFVGEDFLSWAGEYFSIDENKSIDSLFGGNLNTEVPRSELYNDFLEKTPTQRKYMTPQRFKKKVLHWCEYLGLKFNPQHLNKDGQPGGDDKRGGVEYFTIANARFSE